MDNFLEEAIKSIEDKIKGSDVDGSIKFKIEDLGDIS